MNEHFPGAAESENNSEIEIERIMDSRGISYSEAQKQLGLQEDVTAETGTQEPRRSYTSLQVPNPRTRNFESKRDGETFEVIDTSGMTNEQASINARWIPVVRGILAADKQPLTPHDLARARAKQDRRARNY